MSNVILQTENVVMSDTCPVCLEYFINIPSDNYYEWLENMKNKYKSTIPASFEDDTTGIRYNDLWNFHCSVCNIKICSGCVMKFKQGIVCANFSNIDGKLESDGYTSGRCVLTDNEIETINDNYSVDLKSFIEEYGSSEWPSPSGTGFLPKNIVINNKHYYKFERGTPGEDAPVKCPYCRGEDNKLLG